MFGLERTLLDPIGRAFAPVGRFVSGLVGSNGQPAGNVPGQYQDYRTGDVTLDDVIVIGARNAQRGAVDFFRNGYLNYIAPVVDRVAGTVQAFGGGIRDLYLPEPSIGRTSLPTGYADAMGNSYPGTGPLPGNDYNPIAHPWTTAGMAAGVVAAPYAAIGGGAAITAALARPVLASELTIAVAEIAAGDAIGGGAVAAVGAGGVYAAGKLADPVADMLARSRGVGNNGLPQLRQAYVDDVRALDALTSGARLAGQNLEMTARMAHAERNALKIKYRQLSPPDEVLRFEQRNINRYGDPLGPSINQLRASGKSWSDIIDSALKPGGKDLGF